MAILYIIEKLLNKNIKQLELDRKYFISRVMLYTYISQVFRL